MTRGRAGVSARVLVVTSVVTLASALVVGTASVPAAGGSVAAQSSTGAVEIEIGDDGFSPARVVVAPGTTVRWTNLSDDEHRVMPDAGSEFDSRVLEPGESYEHVFEEAGTFGYHCSLHGAPGVDEFGTVRVTGRTPTIDEPDVTASGSGTTIRVPRDERTIQRAVDASTPGSLILVAPGVYEESVVVDPEHPDIVIRGLDRDRTIVDGGLSPAPGRETGFRVLADGVAIENLTVRNFVGNGILWLRVEGYRGSYLTSVRNGEYGLYAYESTHGQFDHSYASGSADAGFYIGQCDPCDALIVDSEAEWNGLGYSGTDAGGNLVLARSSWHDNRAGISISSTAGGIPTPTSGTTIVGNDLARNTNVATAAVELAGPLHGIGIALAGSNGSVVERNLVSGQSVGIAVLALPNVGTQPAFGARDNTVRDNTLFANGIGLAAAAEVDDLLDPGGNCFAGNTESVTAPVGLQLVLPCAGTPSGYVASLELWASVFLAAKPEAVSFRTVTLPAPPRGQGMAEPRTARARPATNEPSIRVRVARVPVPTP